MQLRSGLAKVTTGDLNRIEFDGITVADAALLAPGQFFQFGGESAQFYTVASVVSVVPPVIVDLTGDYAGSIPVETLTTYLIWASFTPNQGFILVEPGDVDIRGAMKYNAQLLDTLTFGGGGGGSGFTKQGVTSVSAGAFSVTITPAAGSFPTPPYGIVWSANWPTWGGYSGQTTGQWVLTVGVEAPASAEVTWGVFEL